MKFSFLCPVGCISSAETVAKVLGLLKHWVAKELHCYSIGVLLTKTHFKVPGFEDEQVQAVALIAAAVVPDVVDFQANP